MPASSVNTNVGAMAALQSLNATVGSLSSTQRRISTGFRVGNSVDDGAAYAVANSIKSDIAGLAGVNQGLGEAKAQVGSAMTAGQKVADTMSAMRVLAVQAGGALTSDQRAVVQKQMNDLRTQLDGAAGSSSLTSGANQDLTVKSSANSSITVKSTDLTSQGLGLAAPSGTGTTASGAASVLAVQVQTGQQAVAAPDPLDLSTQAGAAKALATLDQALKTASSANVNLGSSSRRIEAQTHFNTEMSNALSSSLGAITDADLAKESASLQSLQIRQQLGTQSLSLANQAPQSLLSLFG